LAEGEVDGGGEEGVGEAGDLIEFVQCGAKRFVGDDVFALVVLGFAVWFLPVSVSAL